MIEVARKARIAINQRTFALPPWLALPRRTRSVGVTPRSLLTNPSMAPPFRSLRAQLTPAALGRHRAKVTFRSESALQLSAYDLGPLGSGTRSRSRASSHSPQPTTRSRVWLSRSLGSLCPLRPDDLLLSLSFKQNQLSGEPRYEHVTGSRLFGSSTRRLGGTRFLRLPRLRDGTELLHHTQIIVALPLLDYLAPSMGCMVIPSSSICFPVGLCPSVHLGEYHASSGG